jgi:hypothetical protein
MDSAMLRQKLLHLFAPVDGPTVPEQKDRSAQVLEQVFEKGAHIQSVEIPAAKLCIERQAFPLGRKSKGTNGRDPILFVEMIENRGFSPGSPRPGHGRDQQEPRFIEKDQMGPKCFRFFLNTATAAASNVQSLPRYAARLDAQASDSSTPSPPAISIRGLDDRWYQSVSGSPRQSVSTSKDPFGTLTPKDRPAEPLSIRSSDQGRVWEDDQESASNAGPWTLTPDTLAAIGRQNSWTLPVDAPHPTRWPLPVSTTQWHVPFAFPVLFGFHGVSCSAS